LKHRNENEWKDKVTYLTFGNEVLLGLKGSINSLKDLQLRTQDGNISWWFQPLRKKRKNRKYGKDREW